jgi:hypothetical protein
MGFCWYQPEVEGETSWEALSPAPGATLEDGSGAVVAPGAAVAVDSLCVPSPTAVPGSAAFDPVTVDAGAADPVLPAAAADDPVAVATPDELLTASARTLASAAAVGSEADTWAGEALPSRPPAALEPAAGRSGARTST